MNHRFLRGRGRMHRRRLFHHGRTTGEKRKCGDGGEGDKECFHWILGNANGARP